MKKQIKQNSIKLMNIPVIAVAIAWFGLTPFSQGVSPAPDGGYPNFTTAEGTNALKNLTTGVGNTAVGWFSLFSDTDGSFNTGVGAGTLFFDVGNQSTGEGVENTAVGAVALFNNTTGSFNTANGTLALFSNTEGSGNTATGVSALNSNTTGDDNTASGTFALINNTEGSSNTAIGRDALFANTTGADNTATGRSALGTNTTGTENTAIGVTALGSNTEGAFNTAAGNQALFNNTTGPANTAIGVQALLSTTTGGSNTAIGVDALSNNTTGNNNTAVGDVAGISITGSGNVCIGAGMAGELDVDNKTYIRNIADTAQNNGVFVTVDPATGRLGFANTSSQRYKENIKPMDEVSEAILELRPVTFRYKPGVDAAKLAQFGLIAEEVAKTNPDLVTYNKKGEVFTVRYDAINMMLLNEFLKEHKKVQEQQATITELKCDFQTVYARQQKEIEILSAQIKEQSAEIQRVSAKVEISQPAPKVVLNNP
jgi:hypothetical protein